MEYGGRGEGIGGLCSMFPCRGHIREKKVPSCRAAVAVKVLPSLLSHSPREITLGTYGRQALSRTRVNVVFLRKLPWGIVHFSQLFFLSVIQPSFYFSEVVVKVHPARVFLSLPSPFFPSPPFIFSHRRPSSLAISQFASDCLLIRQRFWPR